jgi:hypothetical protein
VLVKGLQLCLRQVLDVDQPVTRALHRGHELVELQLDGQAVFVLRPLNEKDHQERDDGRAGVDDQLPRVGPVKQRAGQAPHGHRADRHPESPTAAGDACDDAGESRHRAALFRS